MDLGSNLRLRRRPAFVQIRICMLRVVDEPKGFSAEPPHPIRLRMSKTVRRFIGAPPAKLCDVTGLGVLRGAYLRRAMRGTALLRLWRGERAPNTLG